MQNMFLGLLRYFESAEVLAHYNQFKEYKKELRRQKARHRRMPGNGVSSYSNYELQKKLASFDFQSNNS